MAQLYCTGPALVYVGFATPQGAATAAFLGTCEDAPRIDVRPAFEPVYNDLGGKIPFDMLYEGEEAFITADLNRWDERIYAQIAGRPRSGQGGVRGLNGPSDVGSLMLTEFLAFALWIAFPFVAKAAMAAGAMPAGYRFPSSVPVGPDGLYPLGTKARKIHLMFHALRAWTPRTGQFLLYDHNMVGLPPIT